MSEFAIVIIGYNRLVSLKRLVGSLLKADYFGDKVDLIISLDNCGERLLVDYAESIVWPYGQRKIIAHEVRLGLKKHVLKCGELTDTYENLCVLEDDLYVSPGFYAFAKSAVAHFSACEQVVGISLYSHQWNPYVNKPFCAIEDGHDVYLMQIASSWGQVWSRNSWRDFVAWLAGKTDQDLKVDYLPQEVSSWSEKSWLKFHNGYLAEKEKYFVYPRCSLTTNFSDPGEHAVLSSTYQVPFLIGVKKNYSFPDDVKSSIRYDSFFESLNVKLFIDIDDESLDVSFYENKATRKRYLLTSKIYDRKIIMAFGMRVRPIELNVIYAIPGDDLFLYDMSVVEENRIIKWKAEVSRFLYYIRSNAKRDFLISALFLYADAVRKIFFK